jgi:hypothetical protein
MIQRPLFLGALSVLCVSAPVHANDFPTVARVEYVVKCMNKMGEQSYDSLYKCSCSLDHVAERMSYADFAEASAFAMLRGTPGEKGGVFRDPPKAGEMREALDKAEAEARSKCLIGGS